MATLRHLIILLVVVFSIGPANDRVAGQSDEIRVMSFNIRYGTANDGENHWNKRKEFLLETIKSFDPDLLGTQETLGFQRDYLASNLPGYDVLGVGRDDGRERGEMTALFFRRERFEKIDGGHFWLSETPDRPGSVSWDSSLTRMVSWVRLRDRHLSNDGQLVFFNTHFDHRGVQARIESARLLRSRIDQIGNKANVIVTGDFNAGEGSEPYNELFGPDDTGPSPLRDAFRFANPQRKDDEGTFSGFRAGPRSGQRIDWIGISQRWQVIKSEIDRTSRDGHTPSDHFPVTAVLRI